MPTPRLGDLADAIWRLGGEMSLDHIKPATWKTLRMMRVVRPTALKLTAKGIRIYNAIEAGDDVPELEFDWPEGV